MPSIVDENNRLLGLITDGDIRRSLEKGHDFLNERVDKLMTPHPCTITPDN